MQKNQIIKGTILNPSNTIGAEYAKAIVCLIDRMHKDALQELKNAFNEHASDSAMDGSISSQGRIKINFLKDKWESIFNKAAKKFTDKMIRKNIAHSKTTLGMSLKNISKDLSIKFDNSDVFMSNIIKASTEEAANLIKTIPQDYLNDVQGQVMRSISSGNGLADLVPYMNSIYKNNARHARLVALDQTRKTYNSINLGQMRKIGVSKFEWIHSGGGKHPRAEHIKLNGKVFDIDKPPFIGVMYGKDIYGFPAQLPNCRCTMRPLVSFGDDNAA